METYKYTCEYCQKEFIPTRRKIQKYCSDSCRSTNHQYKKRLLSKSDVLVDVDKEKNNSIERIEKLSWAGVGNSIGGSLVADRLKKTLTKHENWPATKKDLEELKKMISNNEKTYERILKIIDKDLFIGFHP